MITKQLEAADVPVVASVIPTIFVTNLEEALEWYCRCLKFRVLAFNPNFATLEMSPGRICWIHKNPERKGQGQLNFHVKNAVALHEHLVREGVEVDPLEIGVADTIWYMLRDPDGNAFGVWSGLFGLNETDNVNRPEFPKLMSYKFVKLPAIRCAGAAAIVGVDNPEEDISNAVSQLNRYAPRQESLFFVNPILEKYAGVQQYRLWVCCELPSDSRVPDDLVEITIPEQNYAVFSFTRSQADLRKEYSGIYRWLSMQFGFLKTAPGSDGAYHLEFIHEDRIEAYIPYAIGPNETHDYE